MKFPEQYRWKSAPGGYATGEGDPFGCFIIPGRGAFGRCLRVIACDAEETGWEHVSVTLDGSQKPPSWDEMCAVKDLFWDEEECVLQFHPPKSEYVNRHPGCLHLWRNARAAVATPPKILVA